MDWIWNEKVLWKSWKEKGYDGKELILASVQKTWIQKLLSLKLPESVVKQLSLCLELLGSESHLYCQVGDNEFIAKVDARDYLWNWWKPSNLDLTWTKLTSSIKKLKTVYYQFTDTIETETICLYLFHFKEHKTWKKTGGRKVSHQIFTQKALRTAMVMVLDRKVTEKLEIYWLRIDILCHSCLQVFFYWDQDMIFQTIMPLTSWNHGRYGRID